MTNRLGRSITNPCRPQWQQVFEAHTGALPVVYTTEIAVVLQESVRSVLPDRASCPHWARGRVEHEVAVALHDGRDDAPPSGVRVPKLTASGIEAQDRR